MTTRLHRGFTLVEVMVSVALLSFIMAGITMVLVKQSQASTGQIAQRDLEESGRLALLDLGRAIRQAGYGITPVAAFDFDRFACTTPGTASTCPNGGRDRSDGPDEIVVAWRDPMFVRTLTAKTGTGPYTLTLGTTLTQALKAGRIVQLLCNGAEPSSYVALNADAAVGDTTVTVRVLANADGYFPQAAPTDVCFASGSMFLVERVRYYVANDPTGVPSLYRDRGRGTQELLYRGIEDLQLSYDIGQPPAGSAFAAGGATPAAAPGCTNGGVATWGFGECQGAVGAPSETATAPDWRNDAYDSANRYTGYPANIRNVNILVVARAISPNAEGTGDPVPAVQNFNMAARNPDNFRRALLSVSEQPENLLSRAHFLPPVFTNGNVGGG
jgi:prepilin-type N-terminal cleavage/methylation domain-containing protein